MTALIDWLLDILDRLLGRVGAHRRTAKAWADMEAEVAKMAAQDELIGRTARQRDDALRERDEQAALTAAAAAQVEEFRQRLTAALERAARAEASATAARADLFNARAISTPMYATEAPTSELPIVPVMTLQAALGAA